MISQFEAQLILRQMATRISNVSLWIMETCPLEIVLSSKYMAEPTLIEFLAKDNKKLSFEERAKKFEAQIEPICKELGVVPSAVLVTNSQAIMAVPNMKDLWSSGTE